jgi:hypothetical protein
VAFNKEIDCILWTVDTNDGYLPYVVMHADAKSHRRLCSFVPLTIPFPLSYRVWNIR